MHKVIFPINYKTASLSFLFVLLPSEMFFCHSLQFDALVAALPLSSEEDQLKRIQELQVGI
jgi:hypothetical protein